MGLGMYEIVTKDEKRSKGQNISSSGVGSSVFASLEITTESN